MRLHHATLVSSSEANVDKFYEGILKLRKIKTSLLKSDLSLFIFLITSANFFLSQFYRASNAVIANDLLEDLALDTKGLGAISAAFFYDPYRCHFLHRDRGKHGCCNAPGPVSQCPWMAVGLYVIAGVDIQGTHTLKCKLQCGTFIGALPRNCFTLKGRDFAWTSWRVSNLAAHIGVDPSRWGLLTAAYFIIFGAFIPWLRASPFGESPNGLCSGC